MYNKISEIMTSAEENPFTSRSIASITSSMGRDRHRDVIENRRFFSRVPKHKSCTAPTLLTASASSLVTSSVIPSSITSIPPLTFHKCSTWTGPEMCQGKKATYSDWTRLDKHRSSISNIGIHTQEQLRPSTVTATTQFANRSRQQQLDNVHMRSKRKVSNSFVKNQAMVTSYCTHSKSTTQKSSLASGFLDALHVNDTKTLTRQTEKVGEEMTEEDIEMQRIIEKCLNWMAKLPAKFSGMYILQQRSPVMLD